jgi:hypothetical protein
VLATDRQITSPASSPIAGAATAAEFTIVEMRIDGKGVGEAKVSLTPPVVDAAAKTLAIDATASAPVLLKVTR